MIDAKALSKHYGRKLAVDQLSFNVRAGRRDRLPRPERIGKVDDDAHDHGPGRTQAGERHREWPALPRPPWPLHEVGALLEAKAIHPGRSARAHLRMLAETNHIPLRRIDEVLETVGLTSVAGQRAGKFSLGMGQRLGIAAALLGDPEVLLFDEPVNGLDPDGIRWVRNLLKGLAREGRTVFVSSHLMSEMALTADEVVIIGKGRLIAQVPVDELLAQSSQRFVRVRSPEIAKLRVSPRVRGRDHRARRRRFAQRSRQGRGCDRRARGQASQVALHELSPQSASLEEAFMELTEQSVEYHGAEEAAASVATRGGAR